jgi:beta-1,4-mannosyl-glycoprotein beta-1,4-N-acetylglucosaminyltransferase
MKVAKGEYIVLLNNDIVLLEQPKNLWIDMMLRAFWDSRMAIAGPMMSWCPWAEYQFLIGFCIMIRKEFIYQQGMYDESFEAYGEDTDLCIRAQRTGWKITQVPDNEIRRLDGQPSVGTGVFPIWHKGNESYRNWPGGEELLAKNRKILHDRYATNIGKAKALDGWISDEEMRWLAQRARQSKVFVQVGAWHGKSSRAIADNLPPDGKLYDIDKWTGSQAEMDTNHWSARLLDGDHAFNEYCRGMWDHLASGKVTPLKMYGKNGAALLRDMGIKADTVFIDAGHGPGETKADIEWFLPLRKEGCVIAGHDYMHEDGVWPDVGPEVKGIFGSNVGQPPGTHIWYTDSDPRPKVYDCFTFFNELELLELRFNELWDVVDRFVIVEAKQTHQFEPKPLYFGDNLKRFEKFLSKVTHIVTEFPEHIQRLDVEGMPPGENWALERYQREDIMRGLTDCKDNDICIISDADEIPSLEAVRWYKPEMGLCYLDMKLFCYYLNVRAENEQWREARILPYGLLKRISPCGARYSGNRSLMGTYGEPIPNGGWHFSFMGGADKVKEKIKSYAHAEYRTKEILDSVETHLSTGTDVFGREGCRYEMVEVNGDHPRFIQENYERYRELGFVK